jgi:hypothetical protein
MASIEYSEARGKLIHIKKSELENLVSDSL